MGDSTRLVGYDSANKIYRTVQVFSDGSIGTSANSGSGGGGDATAANQVTGNNSLASIDASLSGLSTGLATSSLQTTGNASLVSIDASLSGLSAGLATSSLQTTINTSIEGLSVRTTSGPTALITNQSVAAGASVGAEITTTNYRDLTIFGKTNEQSTWKLVYQTASGQDINDAYPEPFGITSQLAANGTSGASWNFAGHWDVLGSDYVTMQNFMDTAQIATFFYTLGK